MSRVVDVENAADWAAHVLESRVPVLVDFWHDACHWCHVQDPELRELAEDYSGNVKFVRLNIFGSDTNRAIAQHYQVLAAPFLLLVCQRTARVDSGRLSAKGTSQRIPGQDVEH